MGTSNAMQLTLFGEGQGASVQREAIDAPQVQELVEQLVSELSDWPDASGKLLDQIHHYLFVHKKLKATELEKILPPDLFITLYGLKSMLLKHSPRAVAFYLAAHKARFRAFLESELED
ncbi:MAG: hypothetical protein KDD02_02380 [Phaeodactylibacter sp.]|nr:hypothetical protein [Phaeodactylibacter sp.]